MQKPTDYPISNASHNSGANNASDEITYAVLQARVKSKQPVTDEMIRIARSALETAHSVNESPAKQAGKFKLPALRKRSR